MTAALDTIWQCPKRRLPAYRARSRRFACRGSLPTHLTHPAHFLIANSLCLSCSAYLIYSANPVYPAHLTHPRRPAILPHLPHLPHLLILLILPILLILLSYSLNLPCPALPVLPTCPLCSPAYAVLLAWSWKRRLLMRGGGWRRKLLMLGGSHPPRMRLSGL